MHVALTTLFGAAGATKRVSRKKKLGAIIIEILNKKIKKILQWLAESEGVER